MTGQSACGYEEKGGGVSDDEDRRQETGVRGGRGRGADSAQKGHTPSRLLFLKQGLGMVELSERVLELLLLTRQRLAIDEPLLLSLEVPLPSSYLT